MNNLMDAPLDLTAAQAIGPATEIDGLPFGGVLVENLPEVTPRLLPLLHTAEAQFGAGWQARELLSLIIAKKIACYVSWADAELSRALRAYLVVVEPMKVGARCNITILGGAHSGMASELDLIGRWAHEQGASDVQILCAVEMQKALESFGWCKPRLLMTRGTRR